MLRALKIVAKTLKKIAMKITYNKLVAALERLELADNNLKYISNLKACRMHAINYIHKYERCKSPTIEQTNLYNRVAKPEEAAPFSLLDRIILSIQDYNYGSKPF